MSTIKQILTLVVLVILLSFAYMFRSSIPMPPRQLQPEPIVDIGAGPDDDVVMCTMDAMMCPDGTYVGRSGPNCEFVCPSSSAAGGSTSLYEEFTVGLDQSKVIGPLTITPVRIENDSRCPSDVVCIQAGTVEVSTKLFQQGVIDSARVLRIGEPTIVGDLEITLKDVQPYPMSSQKPSWQEYKFVMDVRGR
jgi:hypothetical protein